jgi:hypothetical protein
MLRVVAAIGAAAAVAAAVFVPYGMYTWTAIHSGWSDAQIRAFFVGMWVLPLVAGLATGWLTFRRLDRRRAGAETST